MSEHKDREPATPADAGSFVGERVRLVAVEPERVTALNVRWNRNDEFARLMDSDPPVPWSTVANQSWLEKHIESEEGRSFPFMIHTLEGDRPIGFTDLGGVRWRHGDAWVGIGIGDPDDWGKGYGTDAMRVLLRYAFRQLGLHRVSLEVFEYNARAARSYEKSGFVLEGRAREALQRDGRRWDVLFMGILREEWEKRQS